MIVAELIRQLPGARGGPLEISPQRICFMGQILADTRPPLGLDAGCRGACRPALQRRFAAGALELNWAPDARFPWIADPRGLGGPSIGAGLLGAHPPRALRGATGRQGAAGADLAGFPGD